MIDYLSRRAALAVTLATCALGWAHAQAPGYPAKPVRLVVPFTGGVTDTLARQLSKQLGEQLGQPLVVDVRGGAGGLLGSGLVARSSPDGYTLLLGTSSLAIATALNPSPDFDPERDLTPIAPVLQVPYVILASSKGRLQTLQDVIKAGQPGGKAVTYSSPGVGSGPHLTGELLTRTARIHARHIPYNGGAAQVTAVLSGEVDLAILSLVTALPQVRAGTLRPLAVSSQQPAKSLPGVPTLNTTFPDFPDINTWFAVFGPKGLPAPIRDQVERELGRALASPDFVAQRADLGAVEPVVDHTTLARLLSSERARWSQLVKDANLRP